MRLRLTPSGLTMDRVRSSAIRFDPLSQKLWGTLAADQTANDSRAVYLGASAWGNLSGVHRSLRKYRFRKDFSKLGAELGLDREALPAAAFALHVGIAEAERLVQPLLHEVHDRPIDQRNAAGVDEYLHAPVLEHEVARRRLVGIVDHVRKPGTPGLAHSQAQANAVAPGYQERFDTIGSGFCQRDSHRFRGSVEVEPFYARLGQCRRQACTASSSTSKRPSFSIGTPWAAAQSMGVPGCKASRRRPGNS